MSSEFLAARLIAKRYENEGYVVSHEPSESSVPFPLHGYRPDILACREDECILIEIKTSAAKIDTDFYLRLNEEIARHPGWKFALVTVNPEDLNGMQIQTGGNVDVESVRKRLEMIDRIGAGADSVTLVFPQLWAVYLTVLRMLVGRQVGESNGYSDLSVLNRAYSDGLVSIDELDQAKRFMTIRNQAVHDVASTVAQSDGAALRHAVDVLMAKLPA